MWFSCRLVSRGRRSDRRRGDTSSKRARTATLSSSLENLEARQLLSVSTMRVQEGDRNRVHFAVFEILLSPRRPVEQTLTLRTIDFSGKAGVDYVALSPAASTINVAPRVTSVKVPVAIIGNTIHQPNRKFGLQVNGINRVAYGIATIIDDDPQLSHIRVTNPRRFEGDARPAGISPTTPVSNPAVPNTPSIPAVP